MAAVVVRAPEVRSDEDLQSLYNWVDDIPLSRPKRNISRDFADGVLAAEIMNHFFPRLVEMHNYSSASSQDKKHYNWTTLNTKVFKKIAYQIHAEDIQDIITAKPNGIEKVLLALMDKVNRALKAGVVPSSGRPSVSEPPAPPIVDRRDRPPMVGENGSRAATPSKAGNPSMQRFVREVDTELLVEKEQTIAQLRDQAELLQEKIKKLEQLVRIKDSKIEAMQQKLQKYGLV